MGNFKLKGKDLKRIKYKSNRAKSLAIDIINKHYKHVTKQEILDLLIDVSYNPENYVDDVHLSPIATEFMPDEIDLSPKQEIALKREEGELNVFGRQHISSNAYQQMELAMRLPITEKGALMPDAHAGYGLPIGGVLATKGAVIPYGVGLDIGCRMSLSIYDLNQDFLNRYSYQIKCALKERTCFGTGGELGIAQEHDVLDREEFNATELLRRLHGKAARQLGTSGSGNHFVEFGKVKVTGNTGLDLPEGDYVGILAHSGSRGLGATVAQHYTDIAKSTCLLPRQAGNLAWLDMESEAGQEYWMSMNLAGEYAKACHDQIHYHLAKYMGIKPIGKIENHHNFAWKETQEDGAELIVHRKGATPAHEGQLGIIPGSMTATGYIVKGTGEGRSLNSAAHGAGRKLSRTKAKSSITRSAMNKYLKSNQVTLIGGNPDEAPMAYKNIEDVMSSQKSLVQVVGEFQPSIVRMDKS
ncbi:MAG: RtcB family protein [Bacteroidota bacterium]